jgi:hypothetical protein
MSGNESAGRTGGWIGRPVPRVEDDRLLRGDGRYVDDIDLPGAVEAAVLRSPHAHARIDSADVRAALEAPSPSGPAPTSPTCPPSSTGRSCAPRPASPNSSAPAWP